jgi:hypothetical protein
LDDDFALGLFDHLLGEKVEEPSEDGIVDGATLFESVEEILDEAGDLAA